MFLFLCVWEGVSNIPTWGARDQPDQPTYIPKWVCWIIPPTPSMLGSAWHCCEISD